MKKLMLIAALSAVTVSAHALDLGVAAVQDFTANKDGVRVTIQPAGTVLGVAPSVAMTLVNDAYNRYGVSGIASLGSEGPVKVNVTGGVAFQDSKTGRDGFGLTAGVNAVYGLTKAVDVTASFEHMWGQTRINSSSGNTATVGLKYKM